LSAFALPGFSLILPKIAAADGHLRGVVGQHARAYALGTILVTIPRSLSPAGCAASRCTSQGSQASSSPPPSLRSRPTSHCL
jgi:hypothetical protein